MLMLTSMTMCSLTLQASPINGSAVGCNAPPVYTGIVRFNLLTLLPPFRGLGYVNCVTMVWTCGFHRYEYDS
ncbi:hypothetical protein HanPI659440_Chr13g0508691 [Helianthus annuus]|nr:hypothetical protein HanPI659440_Chr13g0508691 [Helianthus annuus]